MIMTRPINEYLLISWGGVDRMNYQMSNVSS
jgi:hypothetical protein